MRRLIHSIAMAAILCLAVFCGCSNDDQTGNSEPVIQSITASNLNPGPAETITFTCEAADADGDDLSYAWTANDVAIGVDAASIQWQAPAVNGSITISVEVSDGTASTSRSLVLRNEFFLLTAVTDLHLSACATNWIQPPTYVFAHRTELYIVDLRSALTFQTGHIEGAHNVPLAALTDSVGTYSNGQDVAVVCDTGQISAFAAMGLRMLGFEAFCMKWGMAGWNDISLMAGPWDSGISNQYSTVMSNNASPNLPVNDWPTLHTGLSSGQAVLEARVAAIFAEGYSPNVITAYEVMDNPGSFHIHNYWMNQDYEDIGHIAGSYQLTPGTLTTDRDLSALNPTQTNVLYCWTGQTSSFFGFYLNVLGYDLVSLRFGANALMHDDLTQERWEHQGHNYPYVTN